MGNYKIFTVYSKKNLRRSQKWWVTIDHANSEPLFRSTEGLANRAEAIERALDVAKPGDRICVEHRGQKFTWIFERPDWVPKMLRGSGGS